MWLLEANVRKAMEHAESSGFTPSSEQLAQFEARFGGDASAQKDRILTIAGDNAAIAIKGVVTQSPSFMAMIFGGGSTTYPEINAAIAAAEQDDSVSNITYEIESPGGAFDGLFNTLAAMQSAKKPSKAIIGSLGASAAYAMASQADKVVASNIAARIGSIGVVATFYDDEREISITSTEAPRKRPDIRTEEGVAMVREELDAMHEIFVDAIAQGRGTTPENINESFGRGGTVLAREALKRGMIDEIAATSATSPETTKTTTAASGTQLEPTTMDLNTLKAQHPETFASAVQQGTTEERDRVQAHLMMGESSGDMKTASAAIKDGSGMTATLQATYMTAGMNRSDIQGRQADSALANAGDNANNEDEAADPSASVMDIIEAKLGLGE